MPKQVLVVDDDQNAVKYLSALLTEHGYEPRAAYDHDGLALALEGRHEELEGAACHQGAERATYALKLLQSEGELTIASTGKDPQTDGTPGKKSCHLPGHRHSAKIWLGDRHGQRRHAVFFGGRALRFF